VRRYQIRRMKENEESRRMENENED